MGRGVVVVLLGAALLLPIRVWAAGPFWREGGVLHFEHATVAEVVAEFNRFSERQIVIGDAGLGATEIGGGIDVSDADKLACALKWILGARVETRGRVILVARQ